MTLLLLLACSFGFSDGTVGSASPTGPGAGDSGGEDTDTDLEETGEPDDTGVPVDTALPDTVAPRGVLDHAGCDGLWGWALDDDAPDRSLGVRATFDSGAVASVTADQPRPDVCGSDPCLHGFDLTIPVELEDGASHAFSVEALDPATGLGALIGTGSVQCGEGVSTEPMVRLYESGANYVEYQAIPDVFEKVEDATRDTARRMMPIDLHTWSIANFDRSLLMFSEFSLTDSTGRTLFRYHDEEGAVHVTLAENSREEDRGNNHQAAYSDFRIVEGTYTVTYTLLAGSAGHPSLMLWQQRDGNRFVVLVGDHPTGAEQSSVEGEDGYTVAFSETVSRTFDVAFLDEDNALYKSNANGFESP